MQRALIYTAIAIVLLYVIRALEYEGIHRVQGGEFAKLRTVFEEKNSYDILVIGSSRAECQFYNPMIDSFSGMHSYNAGMTGAVMPLIASTLDAYLVNSAPPRYVILNIDIHSLGDNTDTVYKFPRYFAFLGNEKLYDGLQERDGRFVFFRWLPFYSMPYFSNRYISNSVRGWLRKPTMYDADYELGFAPSITDTSWGDIETAPMIVTNPDIPDVIWTSVDRIRITCSENNIQLIMVISPLYYRQEECVTNYPKSLKVFEEYAAKNQIPFINMGHDSIRFEKQYYADPAHLNKTGAVIFTRRFCPLLMQYLRK